MRKNDMSFLTKVESKYIVEEVNADWKDWVKKAAGLMVGVVMFTQTAKGMEMKNPQALSHSAQQVIQKEAKQTHSKHNYEVKVDVKHKTAQGTEVEGQEVHYKVLKNGKVSGTVIFFGLTPSKLQQIRDKGVNADSNFLAANVTKDSDPLVRGITQAIRDSIRSDIDEAGEF